MDKKDYINKNYVSNCCGSKTGEECNGVALCLECKVWCEVVEEVRQECHAEDDSTTEKKESVAVVKKSFTTEDQPEEEENKVYTQEELEQEKQKSYDHGYDDATDML